jgi:protein-S-isoprenylcysteine O-methyltransferase Ste14
MTFTTIFVIAGVVLLAIFFLIAKLAIRWVIRVIIVGVILLAIAGTGIFWAWSSRLTTKPEPRQQRVAPRRSASTN